MRSLNEPFDACVVGSGAGGSAVAYALCQAGFEVCLLERGPHYTERDFVHDEVAICRRQFWTPDPSDDPHVLHDVEKGTAERSTFGWIAHGVGGGTVPMAGLFFRMRPEELRAWPERARLLDRHYDRVEDVVGVSGNGRLPPLASHPAATLVEQAGAKVGLTIRRTPRGVIAAPYRDRPGCVYCGFCAMYGCEVGAKSSALVTFLREATATKRLTLIAKARAKQVLLDARGRASGVVYAAPDGVERRIAARVVVVACSAIESARLLLLSATAGHEAGLGNAHGLVGKRLTFATFSSGHGRFDLPSEHFPASAEAMPFIDRHFEVDGGVGLFMRPHVNPIMQLEALTIADSGRVYGPELRKRMRRALLESRSIEYEVFSGAVADPRREVSLDGSLRDPLGLPVARISTAVAAAALAESDAVDAKCQALLRAAGARELFRNVRDRQYPFLQAGTLAMGDHPATSVVDADCRVHSVRNLFVSDASVFPTIGKAPFTMTIMANALRVGEAIAARGRKHEL